MRATTFLLAPRSATYRFATSTIHGLPLPQTALHARKQYKIHDKRVQYLPCCAVKSGASANDLQGQAAALLEKQLRLLERERDESLQIANQCTARSKRLMARLDNLKDYKSQQERKQQAGAVRGASAGAQSPRTRPASAAQPRNPSPQGRDRLEAQTHKLVSSALNKNIIRGRNNLDLAAKLEQYIGLLRAELERVRRGDVVLAARVVAQATAPKAAAGSGPGTAASGGGTAGAAAGKSTAGSGSVTAGGAGPAARTNSSISGNTSSRPSPPLRQGTEAAPSTASVSAEGAAPQTRGVPLRPQGPAAPAAPMQATASATGGPIGAPSRTGGGRADGPDLRDSSTRGPVQPATVSSSPASSPSTFSTSPSSASSNGTSASPSAPSSNGGPALANGGEQAPSTAARSTQQLTTTPQQPPEDGTQATAGGLERIFARHPHPDAPPPPSLQAGLGPVGRFAGPSADAEQLPAAATSAATTGDESATGALLESQAVREPGRGAESPSAPGVCQAQEGAAGPQEEATIQRKGEEDDQGQSGGQEEPGDGDLDAAWLLAREWEDGRLALMGLLTPGNNVPGPLALLGPGSSNSSRSGSGDGAVTSAGAGSAGGPGAVAAAATGSGGDAGERSPGSGRPARPYALSGGAVPEGRVQVGSGAVGAGSGEVADARRLAALVRDLGQGLRRCGYVGCDEQVEVVLQAVAVAVAVSRRR